VIEVLYTAAHGGFGGEEVPLGGGAAVCEHLVEEWTRTRPFPFRLITPSILGASGLKAGDVETGRLARNDRGWLRL